MSDERYAFSPEEGSFVDMHDPDPDDPNLGAELLVQDVLILLNKLPKLEAVTEAAEVYKEIRHMGSSRSSTRARMKLWGALAEYEKGK